MAQVDNIEELEEVPETFVSRRPKFLPSTPPAKQSWHMIQAAPGDYWLVNPKGEAIVQLFEPLHEEEIAALGNAIQLIANNAMVHGREAEKNRIRQILSLL